MVLKRVITGVVLGVVTILSIIFRPICLLTVTSFIFLGLWEFFLMIEKKKVRLFKLFGIILGVFIPVSIFFQFPITREWQLFLIVVGLFILFLLELTRKERQETILSISGTVFGVLYVSWCFSFILRIRNLEEGAFLTGFLVLVVKAQDLGAYIIGTLWGRKPLLKRVSPNKSLEGALGGIGLSVISALLFRGWLDDFNLPQAVGLGLLLGVVGQLGDLFESLLKRDCQVKDSGVIFPGMGGVLDVIDSLIFTAPVFYFYITMLKDISFYHLLFR